MAHLRSALLASLFACACTREPLIVSIPFDVMDEAAIVVVEQGTNSTAFAIDATKRDRAPVLERIEDFDGDPELHLTAFLFERTLDELALDPGEIAPVPQDRRSTKPMGMREIRETTIDKAGASAWESIASPTGAAELLRIPLPKPCRGIQFDRFAFEDEEYLAGIVRKNDTTAIALVYSGQLGEGVFYQVTFDGVTKLPLTLPGFSPREIMRGDNGLIYISGGDVFSRDPQIYRGDFDTGFERIVPDGFMLPYGWVFSMVTPPAGSDDPAELYAITEWGQLLRFEGNQWHELGRLELAGAEGLVAYAGRDDIYAIAPDGSGLFHYSDGALREEQTPVTPDLKSELDSLTGLANVPGYGLYAGADKGAILHRVAGGWTQVNEEALIAEISIRSFARLPSGGLVIGGGYGALIQYWDSWGLCDDPEDVYFVSNTASVNNLVEVPGGLFAAGVENQAQMRRIIYTGVFREIPR
jgi:hypothetical protein